MSWEGKLLAGLSLVWSGMSIFYLAVIDMMPGARGWGAGAVVFALLTLGTWYAESRAARRAGQGREDKAYARTQPARHIRQEPV